VGRPISPHRTGHRPVATGLRGCAVSFDRFAERMDLIFLVQCRHGNAQPRGAFGHGGIANRWNEESFSMQRRREIERRLFVSHDPGENRAAGV
jgi:hypothetical protein